MNTELEIKLKESKYAIGRTLLNCSLILQDIEIPRFANHRHLKSVKECNDWLAEDYRNQINFITK